MTFVCTMSTENFAFVAVGATSDEALDAMVQTMLRHRAQYGEETWRPDDYQGVTWRRSLIGVDGGDPDWLRWLATDYYCAHVSGPYVAGEPGTRDSEFIHLRGNAT